MSEINNMPIVVTGEERKHPAIRQLARACIALARLRVAAKESPTAGSPAESADPTPVGEPKVTRHE